MVSVRVGPGAPNRLSCPVNARSLAPRRVHVVARAGEETNPFLKIGSQLVQAGSQFTATLTGTTRIAKRNVVNDSVVFVAGASGRLGMRIVKECAKAGYTVRAGVRSKEKAQDLIESIRAYDELKPQELRRIQLQEFDLFQPDTIAPAIGNAACVISAIGAPEDKPFDTSAPRRIDGEAAIQLVKVAAERNVKRFVMITSLGTTKFGLPASLLNLFWGVLYWKKQAENALIKSGMLYTIVRPGGMERPTDDYKDRFNAVLYKRDSMFTGQISRLQVAELVAECVGNEGLSANKTIECIASDKVPPRTLQEMLEEQPVEITVDELRSRQAAIADVRNKANMLTTEAEELEAQLAEAEEKKLKAETAFSSARSTLNQLKTESAEVLKEASEVDRTVAQLTEQREAASLQEAAAKAVLDAQRASQREGVLLSAAEIRKVSDSVLNPPKEPEAAPAAAAVASGGKAKRASGGLFAGLFGAPKKVEEEEEEKEEEKAPVADDAKPPPVKVAFRGLPAKQAPSKQAPTKQPAADSESDTESPGTTQLKGGGLFGMFQQSVVYADDAEADAVPPSTEKVERAVTKRGVGRKSVKELIERKPKEEKAAAPAASAKAPAKKAPPPKKPAAAPVSAKPDPGLAKKREAAVAAALNNLGVAAKKAEEADAKSAAETNGGPPKAEKPAKAPAAKPAPAKAKAAPAKPAPAKSEEKPAEPEVVSFAGDKAGAQAWIKNWRSKQKVKVGAGRWW